MITTLVKFENSYGGYSFVEYSVENRVYYQGDSNVMAGRHSPYNILTVVTRKKDLAAVLDQVRRFGFKEIASF